MMGTPKERINVTKATMPPYEEFVEAIKPLWESHWITNMGEYHDALEQQLKDYLKVPEVSLMVNGHMALEMAIQAMNFPKGAEVITTPYTFISTTHAIIRNGLVPIFCDIKMEDYTIDEQKIEGLITEKTVAIVPVHVYGNICNVEAIEKIAFKYGLKVIYDAAHAFGEEYCGKGVGSFGDASIFSFHATKVFNSIEGGAVTFSDPKIYEQLLNLKNFGIRSEELVVGVGANAKMNEFCAIMGLCNLQHLGENIEKRKEIYNRYMDSLKDVVGIELPKQNERVKSNYSYFPIIVHEEEYRKTRDELYEELRTQNIYTRKYFYPITSEQACFKNKYKDIAVPNARYVSERVLMLPLYPDLEESSVEKICTYITEFGNSTIGGVQDDKRQATL